MAYRKPPGVGWKNRETYRKHSVPATFQGGEKHEISPILYSSTANYDQAKDVDYIKMVSCNTTGIVRAVVAVDEAFGVERSVATIVRRAADPSEIHKGPIDAAIPGKVPSHQATDLMLVMPHIDAMGFIITVPTTRGHVIAMHVTLSQKVSTDDALEVFRQGRRIKTFRIDDGFLSNTHIFDYLRDLGVPRADMYEVGVWEETVLARGRDLYWIHNIPQEAIVIPENVDAIRARLGLQAYPFHLFSKTHPDSVVHVTRCSLAPPLVYFSYTQFLPSHAPPVDDAPGAALPPCSTLHQGLQAY